MLRSALICLSLALAAPALAQDDPAASSVLSLQAPSSTLELDLEALEEMPVTEFETSTVWTDGVSRFTGVALSDLLGALEGEGKVIHAEARDGYAVEIPVADAVPGGPIVAYRMDGELLDTDMMGPYWIVYPYDSAETYGAKVYEDRSIWQLSTLKLSE